MARPIKQLDEDLIKKLASIHCTMEEIAACLDCSVDTLENRYSEIIKIAKAKGKSSLRRMQYEAAQKGNITMLIWLGKQLLGQTEKNFIENSYAQDPEKYKNVTDEDLIKIAKLTVAS